MGRGFASARAAIAYCRSGGCSTPEQLESLYDMRPLYSKGDTGKGVTIAVVDAFGSPTIAHDLHYFDKVMKIPNPPKLAIIQPAGKVPPFSSLNSDVVGWATETTLDVECAHAMAPGADILLVETPVDETEGTAGFPQIEKAEKYVVDHHLAEVISQSFGATEQTFPDKTALLSLRGAYVDAGEHNVTVVAASGDQGATDVRAITQYGYVYFTRRAVDWPASDPLVTAVGGTYVDQAGGVRAEPDSVWNTTSQGDEPSASGGGKSLDFSRPIWQNAVAGVVGARRGLPDVALEASPEDSALIYSSVPGEESGFFPVGGTSEAAPLFAGIVAVADQVAGRPLGLLNPALYSLDLSKAPGLVDVRSGGNSVSFVQDGHTYSVTGWNAGPGYDLASGLGTVDGDKLVAELAALRPHE
jgi:subtilase family serine protease